MSLQDVQDVQNRIIATANSLGVPANIALAVANRESSFSQAAMGTKGEIGVFQLMPGTATGLGVNASDLDSNIYGGVSYLKQLYDRFGDWGKALAAYNAGPTAVVKNRIPTSTQGYVASIMGKAQEFLAMLTGQSPNPVAEPGAVETGGSLADLNPLNPYQGGSEGGEGGYGTLAGLGIALVVGIIGVWVAS